MSRKQFRIISWILVLILVMTSVFLIRLSFDAASETENWKFGDFDFTKREGVISSYGSLLAAILSFIAILLVLLDLFYQRRLKAIENEEKEIAIIQDYRDNLNIIVLFTEQLSKDVISQYETALEYVEKERKLPTEMNFMSSLPNTYPKLILDVDRVRFFDAIKYFKPSDDWKKLYVDLYKITDFYDKSFEEIRKKHKVHLDKKFKHCRELAIELDEFTNINSDIRNSIINECKMAGTLSTDNPYFGVLQFIKNKSVEIISRRSTSHDRLRDDYINPTSFTVWHDEVWQPAFNEIIDLWNQNGHDSHNLKELLNKIQTLIREYSRLIQDSDDYSSHVETYFKDSYSKESLYVTRLKGIVQSIEESIILDSN